MVNDLLLGQAEGVPGGGKALEEVMSRNRQSENVSARAIWNLRIYVNAPAEVPQSARQAATRYAEVARTATQVQDLSLLMT